MAWYQGNVWTARAGARCSRKDNPRHEGHIIAVTGAALAEGQFGRYQAVVKWDAFAQSIEFVTDLCEPGDDSYWSTV
jgi:hypothetical protein